MYTFAAVNINNYKDLNRIRNTVREFLHDSREFSTSETCEWIKNNPNYYEYIYFQSNIIGYKRASFSEVSFKNSIFIGVDLDTKWQGLGHGKLVWFQILNNLKNEYNFVELKVLRGNFKAISLYLHIGFKEIVTERSEEDLHLYLDLNKFDSSNVNLNNRRS